MIFLPPPAASPAAPALARAIREACPACDAHVAEAVAGTAADYLADTGLPCPPPPALLRVLLARCLERVGEPAAARALLEQSDRHPGRRRWWSGLAGAPAFDPVLWHAMDRRILFPAEWHCAPAPAAWHLDLARLRADGAGWSDLIWFPALRRLLEGLCGCADDSGGDFCLTVSGVRDPGDLRDCERILARQAARRKWPHTPRLVRVECFRPARGAGNRRGDSSRAR